MSAARFVAWLPPWLPDARTRPSRVSCKGGAVGRRRGAAWREVTVRTTPCNERREDGAARGSRARWRSLRPPPSRGASWKRSGSWSRFRRDATSRRVNRADVLALVRVHRTCGRRTEGDAGSDARFELAGGGPRVAGARRSRGAAVRWRDVCQRPHRRESERRDPRADSLEVGRLQLQQRERRRAPQVREAGDQGEAAGNIVTDKLCLPVPEKACATRGGTSLGA